MGNNKSGAEGGKRVFSLNVFSGVVAGVLLSLGGSTLLRVQGVIDSWCPDKEKLEAEIEQIKKDRIQNRVDAATIKAHSIRVDAVSDVVWRYHIYSPQSGAFTLGSPSIYSGNVRGHLEKLNAVIESGDIDALHLPSCRQLAVQLQYLEKAVYLISNPDWYNSNKTLEAAEKSLASVHDEYITKKQYDEMVGVIDATQQEVRTLYENNSDFKNSFLLGGISLKLEVIGLRYFSTKDPDEKATLKQLIEGEIEGLGHQVGGFNLQNHVLLKPFHAEFRLAKRYTTGASNNTSSN